LNFAESQSQKLKIVINILVLGLALYGFSERNAPFSKVTPFERVMVDYLGPLQRSVTNIQLSIADFFEHYLMNVGVSKENVELKKQVGELSSEIFSYQEVLKENKRLKDLLQFGEEIQKKKVLAQIVAWDGSSDFKVLRINKGEKDGVRVLSTVVTADGVVGYIYRVTRHFADILTILDPNNRVDGIIERTRSHGILEGYGNNRCIMKYVTQSEPVILGDLVLTSGLGNIYPKGLIIGKISKIERESYGVTQSIEVRPSVDFSRLEEVIVLVGEDSQDKKDEWQTLDQAEQGRR
jgi:rod shape-determining protein MreC